MKRKSKNYKPYRKSQTLEEERQSWEAEKKRLEFRLSHQDVCFINSVRQEELELAIAIERLRAFDEALEDLDGMFADATR